MFFDSLGFFMAPVGEYSEEVGGGSGDRAGTDFGIGTGAGTGVGKDVV